MTILKRSLQALNSNIVIKNSSFKGNTAEIGGAIKASGSNIVLYGCSFIKNVAVSTGATIHITGSLLALKGTPQNRFTLNSAPDGGVLSASSSTINLTGYNRFTNNSTEYYGGAFYLYNSRVVISGITLFLKNRAMHGGAIYFTYYDPEEACQSAKIIISKQSYFLGNTAWILGGAMIVASGSPQIKIKMLISSGQFVNNTAGECGGAMDLSYMNVTTKNVTITGSRGTAICLLGSNILFTGITEILDNTGKLGGSIYSEGSSIIFTNNSLLQGNNASFGGGIYSVHGTLLLGGGYIVFLSNRADVDGGALYAINTDITLQKEVQFNYNSANRGGAMFFQQTTGLLFAVGFRLTADYNHADEYGGVIFHDDVATHVQCSYIPKNSSQTYLPYCFFRLQTRVQFIFRSLLRIYTTNNTAGKEGDFLYGGLLDRCQMNFFSYRPPYDWLLTLLNAGIKDEKLPFPFESKSTIMTSQPYQLCFCENKLEYNCLESQTRCVYRGQKLMVSILALDQTESTVGTTIKAVISSNARILPSQDPQALPQDCYTLIYNLYSTESSEQLILHPDGPCRDIELSQAVIDVTLLPCPDAFTESGDHCICEERLQEYANCIIDDDIYIEKKPHTKFWMSAYYDENSTYLGLILYKTCPKEYCRRDGVVRLTLESLDTQCSLNRSGVLCGACATNYSLMLGSNECQVCSNSYFALLIPFAVAGIALVVFLSILRLTVATGMINSIILYANIVQANRSIFLPTTNARNILTVFIAWMNLDIGFQACFYDGMDAYMQTWLQFAFPLYVWILISLIIFTSRYSITVSKLLGHNPIAVLATLLLVSYTKILKITIEVYSSVHLEYPDDKTVTVWLKDANVPYLQSWHLLLTVVTTMVLVFVFIPYTLFLLLGYKLYRLSGRKYFRFMNRLKPLLDSYYAPYQIRTRYWTGFLLIVRCALYIVFSYNSLGGTTKSLLAILITFTIIFAIAWLSGKIFKCFLVNLVEASVYVNLITLSGLTLAETNSPAIVYFLIGTVFTTMIAITVYHFHILYIAKASVWLNVKDKAACFLEMLSASLWGKQPAPVPLDAIDTQAQQPVATKSIIDLREPLLDN